MASEFIRQLSKLYRVLLKEKENVHTLEKELELLDSYLYLVRLRFSENLEIVQSIDKAYMNYKIAPLSLQMLIENAIKHNIISRTNPLRTRIFIEDDYIVVQNNLQLKQGNSEGTKIGLSNIKSRYHILFDKEIIISKDEESFIVKLPIIYKYVENFAD